jgi:hypothetical protein
LALPPHAEEVYPPARRFASGDGVLQATAHSFNGKPKATA